MIPVEMKYKEIIGKTVKIDRDFTSESGICVKRGTRARVRLYDVKNGYTVETEKCPCCGNWAVIKGIKKSDITLAEE